MAVEIGIVCEQCEAYNVLGSSTCLSCRHVLALFAESAPSSRADMAGQSSAVAPGPRGTPRQSPRVVAPSTSSSTNGSNGNNAAAPQIPGAVARDQDRTQ